MIALCAVLLSAAAFVQRYPLYYFLHFTETGFTNPKHGAPNYWVMRGWLMLHVSGGMIALLTGPFQFSQSLRRRYLKPASMVRTGVPDRGAVRICGGAPACSWNELRESFRIWADRARCGLVDHVRDGLLRSPEAADTGAQRVDGAQLRGHIRIRDIQGVQ
jgi:hypothetical protein